MWPTKTILLLLLEGLNFDIIKCELISQWLDYLLSMIMKKVSSINLSSPSWLLYITNTFAIVIIFLIIELTTLFAETAGNKPLEIWSNDSNLEVEELATSDIENKIEEDSKNPILQSNISYAAEDTIGFFDQSNNGFGPSIWENSDFESIEYLLNLLPKNYQSVVMRDFLNKTLLTVSTPPLKNYLSDGGFLDLKIDFYKKNQNDLVVKNILDQLSEDDWNEKNAIDFINHYLILNDYKKACTKKYLEKLRNIKNKLTYQTFCRAMESNMPAADLSLSLLKEQDQVDKEFLYLINSYINDQEININEIMSLDILKLNLISGKKINYESMLTQTNDLSLNKFYALSSNKNIDTKIKITEDLIKRGLVNIEILSKNYKNYLSDNNILNVIAHTSAKNDLEKRILLFAEIRNTSNQKKLTNLSTAYVNEMKKSGLLFSTAELIYDKIKVIQPKKEYSKNALSMCILLILNNNSEKCSDWSQLIKFNKDLKLQHAFIEFYLNLNSTNSNNGLPENLLNQIISSVEISDFNKNIIVKYFEVSENIQTPNYWKTKNKLNKVSTIVPNIKLIEYLGDVSKNSIGEAALLILILSGDKNPKDLDDYSIFAMLDSLSKIDKKTLRKLIFELSVNSSKL
jgi:hypothetical protein